jgi:hypothetical protein
MKKLPTKLRFNNLDYTLIWRDERKCLFRLRLMRNLYYYEVCIPKIRKAEIIMKIRKNDEREIFPRDKDFGKSAWSFGNIENALRKINELEGSKLDELEIKRMIQKYK